MTDATYHIKNVTDFFNVPKNRRKDCLCEFGVWLDLGEEAKLLLSDIPVEWPEEFVWLDDNLHTASIFLDAGSHETPIVSGRMKEFDNSYKISRDQLFGAVVAAVEAEWEPRWPKLAKFEIELIASRVCSLLQLECDR